MSAKRLFNTSALRDYFYKKVEEFEATNLPRDEFIFILFIIANIFNENDIKLMKLLKKFKKTKSKILKLRKDIQPSA